jgi:hypothetical protein
MPALAATFAASSASAVFAGPDWKLRRSRRKEALTSFPSFASVRLHEPSVFPETQQKETKATKQQNRLDSDRLKLLAAFRIPSRPLGSTMLRQELDRVPLWRDNHLTVKQNDALRMARDIAVGLRGWRGRRHECEAAKGFLVNGRRKMVKDELTTEASSPSGG